jgi:hypothetical protein
MAKSEDGERCVVSGRECEFPLAFVGRLLGGETLVSLKALRILKVIAPEEARRGKGPYQDRGSKLPVISGRGAV